MDNPLRILIIEDDPDTRANLKDILELDGHTVYTASSYEESQTVTSRCQIGLVISDRRLPEGMIEDFLGELSVQAAGAEIIVVTAYGDMHSTITALRLGVSDYVIKPIIPDDIRGTVLRIAERQRLRRALAEEHQFSDDVLNTAEAIVLVLDLDGRVVRFNPFFEQLTGWTLDTLRGQDWFQHCISPADRERVKNVFVSVAHDAQTRGVVNEVLGIDQQSHRIRWSNTTLKNAEGATHAVLAVGVDISDLAEAQMRALRAERLAAIGQTVTALAHESRNALQRINAATDVLALELADNLPAQEELQSLRRASKDVQGLLEEVRSFSAPLHLNPARACLPDLWRRVWDDLQGSRAGRVVELVESLDGSELDAEMDSSRIEQVLRNLFENSLAACTDPARIELSCNGESDCLQLHYQDNGPGLNAEQRQRMFEPFYTTKDTGTGLGMSICQRIVEAHHGTITIEKSTSGASFLIRLPRRGCATIQIVD
ncbi:hybrid sensor histidine kinase/response regulator [Roseimaritima ulvae]|uniref:histidine kinase n=1 Tax=Roseimaritima ulvae TaxID=980254 RepID=A0A5B9QQ71_9BACT|nr:ATP-binding protein [Roseimaritima ulvae]QEG39665.1 Sensor histidine kinase TmoS [Roseimaritima ulvae]